MAQSADGGGKFLGNCCVLASESGGASTTLGTSESTIPLGDGGESWTSFIGLLLRCHLNSNADHCNGECWRKTKRREEKNTDFHFVSMPWTRVTMRTDNQQPYLDMERFVSRDFSTLAQQSSTRSVARRMRCIEWYLGSKRKGKIWSTSTRNSVEWRRCVICEQRKEKD